MSVNVPLLETIEPDDPLVLASNPSRNINAPSSTKPVVLTPTNRASEPMATNLNDAESGMYSLKLGYYKVHLIIRL